MQQKQALKELKIKVKLKKSLGLNIKKDNTYIIPIFIPHKGCKNECVFCNQRRISGETRDVTVDDVRQEIEKFLNLYKDNRRQKQIAFFGGSFTGLEKVDQERFLNVANEYIEKGLVKSIRVSTRPDYISFDILKMLKEKHVEIVELGVQSMDDEVLLASKRGHTAEDVVIASRLIKKSKLKLGLQVMVGLPKSTSEKEIETMKRCLALKPDVIRIYPVYILKDSKLYEMYKLGEYKALTLSCAVDRATEMYKMCVNNNVNVIRIGLQTTEEINQKNENIAGPVCDNYKERVLSAIARDEVVSKLKKTKTANGNYKIIANPKEINYVVGNNKGNIPFYESELGGKVIVKTKA